MKCIVKYKLKWTNKEQETIYNNKDDVLLLIKQFQRWVASFDSNLIYWIEQFDNFQVIYQNYDQITNWKYLIINIDKEWNPDIYECNYPISKNITNELFSERLVSSKKVWNIHLLDKYMSVCWEIFPLWNKTKIRDIFVILLISKSKNESNIVTYENMEKIFKEWDFKNLLLKDLINKRIRSLLKDKLKEFNDELKIDVLTVTKEHIIINL